MEHNYHMYYDNPAKRWGNALPLGKRTAGRNGLWRDRYGAHYTE